MLMDLYCPLELRGYELLHDDRGHVRIYMRLFNLAHKRIARFDATLRWIDTASGQCADTPFTADQLRAAKRTLFTLSLSTGDLPRADAATLRILRVEFEDGSPAWIWDEKRLVKAPCPAKLPGTEHNALMRYGGRDARNYAARIACGWLCVCGRANPDKARRCIRCGRKKENTLSSLTREAFRRDGITPLPSSVVPDTAPLQAPDRHAIRQRALRRKFRAERAALIRRTLLLLLLAMALALCSVMWRNALTHEKLRALSSEGVSVEDKAP